jgi:hypothetical protein
LSSWAGRPSQVPDTIIEIELDYLSCVAEAEGCSDPARLRGGWLVIRHRP